MPSLKLLHAVLALLSREAERKPVFVDIELRLQKLAPQKHFGLFVGAPELAPVLIAHLPICRRGIDNHRRAIRKEKPQGYARRRVGLTRRVR